MIFFQIQLCLSRGLWCGICEASLGNTLGLEGYITPLFVEYSIDKFENVLYCFVLYCITTGRALLHSVAGLPITSLDYYPRTIDYPRL